MRTFLLGATLLLLLSARADAGIIYHWIGTCDGLTLAPGGGVNGCSGQATLDILVADNYVPGHVFVQPAGAPPTLLDAHLGTTLVVTNLAESTSPLTGLSFQFPAEFPGEGFILSVDRAFRSDQAGHWQLGAEGLRPGCDRDLDPFCGYFAAGTDGVWTRVPEPATFLLLAIGLLLATVARASGTTRRDGPRAD